MAQHEYQNIHVDDYLFLDQNSQNARYEYLEGELRMLAGGSAAHSTIATNLTSILHRLLEEGPCKVYNSDMQLQLSESRYVYPDITVTCDPRDQEPEDNRTHYPTLVVEVLSPSTEVVDRGKKLLYYQAHPTIQEYVMADSQNILVEVCQREKNRWTFSTHGLGDKIQLESLGIQFSVDDIYKRTSLLRRMRES
ncbi:MAG: Uma2 family endonuclease [Chloroflexota bacterium]|nr:Uma2 family endonuclease [Chloroflexota bacterium]